MTRLTAGGASPTTVRRPQPRTPSPTSDDQDIGICDSGAESPLCPVSRTRPFLGPTLLTFAGCLAFLMAIAAAELVAGLLAGIGGVVLCVGVLVVVMCVAARAEGVI